MILANNLCKVYTQQVKSSWFSHKQEKEVVAVEDISLEIKPGQIVGLLGVNGAGKTTMIRMLSGLLEPTSGTFEICDINGVKYPKEVKKMVNVISGGERSIYWRLTARENLEYFGALYNVPEPILKSRIDELIELVGLKEKIDVPVEMYSKGMKQRLQIARGLINDPKVIFLDEPTLGLDIAIAKELRGFVSDLAAKQGKCILLTTHYITEVEELCENVYLIDKGRVIREGSPKDLIAAAKLEMNVSINVAGLGEKIEGAMKTLADKYNAKIKMSKDSNSTTILITAKENLVTNFIKVLMDAGVRINNFNIYETRLEEALMKLTAEVGNNE